MQSVTSVLLKNADTGLKQLITWQCLMHSSEEQLQACRDRATNDSVKMKTCADSLSLGHRNTKTKVPNNGLFCSRPLLRLVTIVPSNIETSSYLTDKFHD